ncbi:hypothetical protein PMAYCL1PPCAC_05541, partial [Pristionchus mayeri]
RSIVCSRQIQLERAKWNLFTKGGQMLPKLRDERFAKQFAGPEKAKLLSCTEVNDQLVVTIAYAVLNREGNATGQLYDEITTGMRMGHGSMRVSLMKNYIIDEKLTKIYVKQCLPNQMDHTVLCERNPDSDA